MKVHYKGVNYHIRFGYNVDGKWGKSQLVNLKDKRVRTQCDIVKKNLKGQNTDIVTINSGESIRHPKDPFTKNEGRKRALSRALYYKHFAADTPAETVLLISDEGFRKAVWEAYFKNHKERSHC
jgi:hypothetical protein